MGAPAFPNDFFRVVRPQGQKSKATMYKCIHGYDIHTIFSFILLIVSGGPNIHIVDHGIPSPMLRGAHGFGWKHV